MRLTLAARRLIDRPAPPCLALLLLLLAGAVGVGIAGVAQWTTRPDEASAPSATLIISSEPPGATVLIDGHERGATPMTLAVQPGTHAVLVRRAGSLDTPAQVVEALTGETTAVEAVLWAATPRVLPLRPPGVGQVIADAAFVAGDRLALTITPYRQPDRRELWLRNPDGRLERSGPPRPVPLLAVAADGARVAYAVHGQAATTRPPTGNAGQPRLDELWITTQPGNAGARRLALADEPGLTGATLTGLLWAPDGHHLVATTLDRRPDGSRFTTFLWIAADGGPPRRLPSIDGEIVAGSWAWSPAGDRVAFLAVERARTVAVLAVLTPTAAHHDEQLRNLADAAPPDSSGLPTSPLAWTLDGRAVLTPVLAAAIGGFLGLGGGNRIAYALSEPGPRPPASAPGVAGQGPGWRDDKTLLTLQPGRDGHLVVLQATLDAASILNETRPGAAAPERAPRSAAWATIPLRLGSALGARWDVPSRRLLVATPGRAGGRDDLAWWWVQW